MPTEPTSDDPGPAPEASPELRKALEPVLEEIRELSADLHQRMDNFHRDVSDLSARVGGVRDEVQNSAARERKETESVKSYLEMVVNNAVNRLRYR